jgi:hypothetical protein
MKLNKIYLNPPVSPFNKEPVPHYPPQAGIRPPANLMREGQKGDFFRIINLLQLFLLLILTFSCENYVTNIDLPSNVVEDDKLNHEDQLPYLINGVKIQFAQTQDRLSVLADALSDAFVFAEGMPDAVFDDFRKIDRGELGFPYDNTSAEIVFADLGELRFYADDLIRRTNAITINDDKLKNESFFTGYLYGAIARYFYATYFALDTIQGGGVIDGGSFIPADQMYDLAIERFLLSIEYTEQNTRLVNSLIARCYLFKGDYTNAAIHANLGLMPGDKALQSLYYIGSGRNNYWWEEAGGNRAQFVVADRFKEYKDSEPARIKLELYEDYIPAHEEDYIYFQGMYPDEDSPINHISWQENHLMKAELAIRGYDSNDPIQLINEVRSSYNLDSLTISTSNPDTLLNILIEERDKELFCRGERLPDQRRFNLWHLGAGSWQYLPITQRERNSNPNIE